MPSSVEKTYAGALFSVIVEENEAALGDTLKELKAISGIFRETPDFVKLMGTPTVSENERETLLSDAFKGRVSDYTYNFLLTLADKGRLSEFDRITDRFTELYNEKNNIAEITITSAKPLSAELSEKVRARMEEITGKTVVMSAKTDPTLIGGIVVDIGNTRLDGSVKTRLEALKKDIGSIIA